MKLKDINQFIFLNPSANLIKISEKLKDFGKEVVITSDNNYFSLVTNKISFHYKDNYSFFTTEDNETNFQESKCLKFKKSFLNKGMNLFDLPFDGKIKELYLFKRKKILISQISNLDIENKQFDSDTLVITPYVKSEKNVKGLSRKFIQIFRVDEDVVNVLKLNLFVFFVKQLKFELFVYKDLIYIVGDADSEILFENYVKFFKKFNLKEEEQFSLLVNENSYIVKFSKNYILLNDFSYYNISISMPAIWYDKLGRFLCTGKL